MQWKHRCFIHHYTWCSLEATAQCGENSAGTHHSCHMLQLQVEAFVSLDPSPPFARLEPQEQQLLLTKTEVLGSEVLSSGLVQQARESPFPADGNRASSARWGPLAGEWRASHPSVQKVLPHGDKANWARVTPHLPLQWSPRQHPDSTATWLHWYSHSEQLCGGEWTHSAKKQNKTQPIDT